LSPPTLPPPPLPPPQDEDKDSAATRDVNVLLSPFLLCLCHMLIFA
jgi:hypothetical protein